MKKKIDWHKKYIEFINFGTAEDWDNFLDFCWENGITDDYDDTDFKNWVERLK